MMGTSGYFILEDDKEISPPTRVGADKPGLKSFGTRSFGRAAKASEPAVPRIKVSTVEMTAAEAVSERKRAGVRMIGRKMPIRLIAPLSNPAPAKPSTSDPIAWGIKATLAASSPFDGAGVTVAVLDTGIKSDHAAFKGMDFTDAIRDFTDDTGKGEDTDGHGSHCAGTIFGRDVDGVRIGVARGIDRALIAKVIADDGSGDSAMLFDALNWANSMGANIVSMSLGFDFPGMVDQLEKGEGLPLAVAVSSALVVFAQNLRAFDAIMASIRATEPFGRNMLVVGAAGNESRRDAAADYRIAASLPSAAVGVVSVAAYGRKGSKYVIAPFSNNDATIAAPGVEIISADIGGGLTEMSGTSQACPHVAGLAALWWQKIEKSGEAPTPDKVREQMFVAATTTKLPPDADETERGRGRALAPKD